MSTIASHIPQLKKPAIVWLLIDSWVMVKRALLQIRQDPEQLLGLTIQPIMFVALFRYVFGGAIDTGGVSYINFLMAGIFVQTAAFGSSMSSYSVAIDLEKGIMDRFRSLPMAKSAVLTGHVVADLIRNLFATIVMVGAGLAVGFRPEANAAEWILAVGLLLFFSFALSWLFVIIALVSKSIQMVQQFGFILIFPLTFVSSAFVPVETMPSWLRVFAENQPLTHLIEAIRALLVGTPVDNHAWLAFIWSIGILVVGFSTTTALFRRQAR
ncbi:MAG: ABC transporter permease [Candidatus Kerfeldbacteria bacterium]|nr:ABC transporter permease [Candidatus Kerfeldbacteria bacterium]